MEKKERSYSVEQVAFLVAFRGLPPPYICLEIGCGFPQCFQAYSGLLPETGPPLLPSYSVKRVNTSNFATSSAFISFTVYTF
jgi:hypothetical protein